MNKNTHTKQLHLFQKQPTVSPVYHNFPEILVLATIVAIFNQNAALI